MGEQVAYTSHYPWQRRVTSAVSRLFDGVTYTQRHGLIAGLRRRGGLGFLPAAVAGGTDTAETRFLRGLDLAGATVFDVGAFQGITTLFFASSARRVIAFEPNPATRRRLLDNLTLNGFAHVEVRPEAVGDAEGELELTFDRRMMGGASADPLLAAQMRADDTFVDRVRVPVVTLDREMAAGRVPAPTFVKVDVEGHERAVLQGGRATLSEHHPALYLEMHGATREDKIARVQAILSTLGELGYDEIVHVESGRTVDAGSAAIAAEGHLFAPGAHPSIRRAAPGGVA